jgi:hypothetical protein
MSGGGASLLPGSTKNATFLGSSFLSTITGLKSGTGGLGVTGNPAGFLGQAMGNKINDAVNPTPPTAPGAPPEAPNDQNSSADLANARRRARQDAGYGSAANILAGSSGPAPTVSSNLLLGS